MNITHLYVSHPYLILGLVGIFSLMVGSFLNVVIYRLPLMLQQNWREQCLQFLNQAAETSNDKLSLSLPRSHCPHCKKAIPAWHNIPLLSFILLRGKCSHCQHKISWRYPVVELSSCLLSIFTVYHFGLNWQAAAALVFTWSLLVLIFIDLDHQLLPDEITLGLVWLGLLLSLGGFFTDPASAIIGAVSGYLSLWLIGWLFKKIRGIDGIGYGDYKLLAALGAWLGWQMLPFIIIASSLAGTILGLLLIVSKKINRRTAISFGPYLAIAGWLAIMYGKEFINLYLKWFVIGT